MKINKVQKFVEKAFTALPKVKRAFSFKISPEIMKYDLNVEHALILREVAIKQNSSIGELGETLDISYAMMTHFVDQLEQKGLVKRRRSSKDRRIVQIVMTAKGKNMFNRIRKIQNEHFSNFLSRFNPQDRKRFVETFNELHSLIVKYEDKTDV